MSDKYITLDGSAIQLLDSVITTSEIECSKCGENAQVTAIDEFDVCREFYKEGWRATERNTYCPSCAKKYLKSSQTKKK